jgi:hypothetical protein
MMMPLFIPGSFNCNKFIIRVLIYSLQLINKVHLIHRVLPTASLFINLISFIIVRDNYHFIANIGHANVCGAVPLLLHSHGAGFLSRLIDN